MFLTPTFLSLHLLTLLPSLTTAVMITATSTSYITATTASPTASSSLSPSATTNPQYTSDSTFQSTILNSTNTYRAEHNATSLSWNASLASYALTWASKCQWSHSHGPNGENLAENYQNVTDAIDGWGDERKNFNFENGGFGEGTGHFTQLVWKATRTVGCARVDCDGNQQGGNARGWFVVCEYYPPGNVEGEYREQVGAEVRRFVTQGMGGLVGYVVYVHDKISGAGRVGWRWSSLGVVGAGMLWMLL